MKRALDGTGVAAELRWLRVTRGEFVTRVETPIGDLDRLQAALSPYFTVRPIMVASTETEQPVIRYGPAPPHHDFSWSTEFWTVVRHGSDYWVHSDDGRGVPRLVRELWRLWAWQSEDALNVHASCVAAGNQGIAIVGRRRGGKTSLMLHFLATGADFVANDDVMMSPRPESAPTAFGSGRKVNIRREAMSYIPDGGSLRAHHEKVGETTCEGWSVSVGDLMPSAVRMRRAVPLSLFAFVRLGEGPLTIKAVADRERRMSLILGHVQAVADDLNAFLCYEQPTPSVHDLLSRAHALSAVEAVEITGSLTDQRAPELLNTLICGTYATAPNA